MHRSRFLGLVAVIAGGGGAHAADYQPSCLAAEPVMLSLMVAIADYCPGFRLTKDGIGAFTDVWNRGERRYGALFMSRCITRDVTDMGWPFNKERKFRVAKSDCEVALRSLEGWRASMTRRRGPLAERLP